MGVNISYYILWYAKNKDSIKTRKLFIPKSLTEGVGLRYNRVEEKDGSIRAIKRAEQLDPNLIPEGANIILGGPITSQDPSKNPFIFSYKGKSFIRINSNHYW